MNRRSMMKVAAALAGALGVKLAVAADRREFSVHLRRHRWEDLGLSTRAPTSDTERPEIALQACGAQANRWALENGFKRAELVKTLVAQGGGPAVGDGIQYWMRFSAHYDFYK